MNQESYKLNLRNDYVFKTMHYMDEEKGKKIFASMIKAFDEQNRKLDKQNKMLDEKVIGLKEENRRIILDMLKADLSDAFIVENTGCTFEYLKSLQENR